VRHDELLTDAVTYIKVDKGIVMAFAGLDIQASSYIGRRRPTLALMSDLDLVTEFHDIHEADNCLLRELNGIYSFLRATADNFRYREPGTIPMHVTARAYSMESRLEKWQDALSSLLDRLGMTLDGRHAQQIALLRIKHQTATVMVATCLHAEETIYDYFSATFRAIVALASDLLTSSSHHNASREDFSVEMGIIQPLYLTAIKCRCVHIRQQAINLLYSVRQSEGVWDGMVMAKIAERVKLVEEEGLTGLSEGDLRVPEFRRVHSVDTDINHKERHARLSCRQRLNGMDGEWDDRVEWLIW
jgi:hypothetical protein